MFKHNKFFRSLSLTFIFLLISLSSFAQVNSNHVKVKGYYRNGTYIQPHYRTSPNSTNRDNFSTVGNTNPYTGKIGYIPSDNKSLTNTRSIYNSNSYKTTKNSSEVYVKPVESRQGNNIFRYCKTNNCANRTRFQNENSNYCSRHIPECSKPNCDNLVEEVFGGFSILCNKHNK